jgi:rubrerythrin
MGDTQENLKAAFAGESQANRRYLFSAEQADKDGHKAIARLFRAVAEAETVHAHNHLRTLGEIKSTKENLEAAIGGEHYEFTKMYPEFIEQAKTEGNKRAETTKLPSITPTRSRKSTTPCTRRLSRLLKRGNNSRMSPTLFARSAATQWPEKLLTGVPYASRHEIDSRRQNRDFQ